MCVFQRKAELSSCAFSSSATEESRWVATGKKKDRIDYSPFSKQKDGDREGMSAAPVACFCFGCSRHEIIRSTNCAILQHLSAVSLRAAPNVTGQLALTKTWQ